MTERLLKDLDGNYRFLISSDQLIIGTPATVLKPDHEAIANAMGLDLTKIKGGYAEIWEQGKEMVFCGESANSKIPGATEEDFEKARKGIVVVFQYEIV